MKKNFLPVFGIVLGVILAVMVTIFYLSRSTATSEMRPFDAERAFQDVQNQLSFGPRTPGSAAHQATSEYIQDELEKSGWTVEIQKTTQEGHPLENIIAKRGSGTHWIILGAHYDTRLVADQDKDPQLAAQPVSGANDGASGVAVLLELARILPEKLDKQVWLVFFDAEDQGNLEGWDWILGSKAFVKSLESKPDAAVIVDMVGDSDLNIYREESSTPSLLDEIWGVANQLGYENSFIDTTKYNILDDHLPFINADIPAVDLIDIDYPYWHTSSDTIDHVSAGSLKIIGDVLAQWLASKR